jgi:hypothetical protein
MIMRRKILFSAILLAAAIFCSATPLSTLVSTMKAGEWAELQTTNAAPVLGQTVGGSVGNVLPYSDDVAWDPGSHRLYFIGSDHQHATGYARFIMYSETTNTWTELPRAIWFGPLTETAMHGYDHTALNPATGELFHRPMTAKRSINRYNIPLGSWRSSFSLPTTLLPLESDMACCIGVSYFPEMKSIVFVDGGSIGHIYSFNTATFKWTMLKDTVALGPYHNVAEYNPLYKVVVGGGGNGSKDVYKIDSLGTVTTMKNAPVNYGINEAVFTVDPVGGDYLLFNNAQQFWAYNVKTDTWTQQGSAGNIFTASYGFPISSVVATPVSNYGVVLFLTCDGATNCRMMIYKRTNMASAEKAPRAIMAPAMRLSSNPAFGPRSVRVELLSSTAPHGTVEAVDVRGKVVATMSAERDNVLPANLGSGFYSIRWIDGNQLISQQKLTLIR